jgi:hypothetical protein
MAMQTEWLCRRVMARGAVAEKVRRLSSSDPEGQGESEGLIGDGGRRGRDSSLELETRGPLPLLLLARKLSRSLRCMVSGAST